MISAIIKFVVRRWNSFLTIIGCKKNSKIIGCKRSGKMNNSQDAEIAKFIVKRLNSFLMNTELKTEISKLMVQAIPETDVVRNHPTLIVGRRGFTVLGLLNGIVGPDVKITAYCLDDEIETIGRFEVEYPQ